MRPSAAAARELEIPLPSGAELAQDDIIWLHAVRDNFSDGYIYGARLPANRRVGRGLKGDALCVIAIFDIERTRFTDGEVGPDDLAQMVGLELPVAPQAAVERHSCVASAVSTDIHKSSASTPARVN
jgi:hypothetical protein